MQDIPCKSNGEEWRPVVGWEGLFEVSDRGRVRQAGPVRSNARSLRMMKQNQFKGRAYLYVGLSPIGGGCQNTKRTQQKYQVHKLVADAFLGPRPPGMVVNHKDGCPLNNWAENLEYCTQAENAQHALQTGLKVRNLTPDKVRALRALPPDVSHSEAGRRFGVDFAQVSRIRRGMSWKHLN